MTAELNHQLAILDLGRAQAILSQRVIRSPVDGVVVQRSLGPGEFIHQNAQIVVLAVISPLHVQAYPPLKMRSQIVVGQSARVTLTEPSGSVQDATVGVVDRVSDPASETFGVQLDLPNPVNGLSAGLRCRVSFDRLAPATPPSGKEVSR